PPGQLRRAVRHHRSAGRGGGGQSLLVAGRPRCLRRGHDEHPPGGGAGEVLRGSRGPPSRRSPRRRVTPPASRWFSRGSRYFRDVPSASRTWATVTPWGWSTSRPATVPAAASTAAGEKNT